MSPKTGKHGLESTETDVIVIGVGTSGEDLSLQLLDAGLDVVGIEPSLVGGLCPYWACLPTKMMIRAANSIKEVQRASELAGKADIAANWSLVAERVRGLTGNWDDSGAVTRFQERGGRLVRGYGKLTGPRSVVAGDQSFTARKAVVIATGSRPVMPSVPGLADIEFWTTNDVIRMQELPESIIILGGGASGCELGQVMARFGVDTTIIEAQDRLLAGEEPEASEVIENTFAGEGIKIHTGTGIQKVDLRDGSYVVTLGGGRELTGERLLVATGRRVELSGLGLQTLGIDETSDFLPVDENMKVREIVYGMGDVTGKGFYSHVGLYQSSIIASRILGRDVPPATWHAVPRPVFTDPEVGSVGLTESEALGKGIPVAVATKQIPATFRGAVHGAESGFVKLVVDSKKDILIGATVAGPSGTDILGILNLAVHSRLPMTELRSMIYAFPSFHSTIGETIGAYGRGVTTALDPSYEGHKILDAVAKTVSHHLK